MSARYPAHDKLAAVQEEMAAVVDFLEAATSKGYQLCREQDVGLRSGFRGERVEPRWMPQEWRHAVEAHFGIDQMELERERRAMLAAFQAGSAS